jgi:uncharacterized protein (TIGR02265 family)
MQDHIVFQNTVVGMLRMLGTTIYSEQRARLLGIGVDPDHPKAVSKVEYMNLLDLLGEFKFPNEPRDKRDFELGKSFVLGVWETAFGKAALSLMRLLGPLRSARRMSQTVRGANNYSLSGCVEISAHEVQLWVSPVQRPHYYFGVFTESGRRMHGDSYRVEMQSFEDEKVTFRISW